MFNTSINTTTFTLPVTLIPGRRYYVELRVLQETIVNDKFVYRRLGKVMKESFKAGRQLIEKYRI